MFAVVDSGDIASAIPPAISQAPKARPPKAKEVSEPPTGDVERPKKSLKEETDITKIRAKHAKEQAEQRHVVGMLTRYQQYLIALCSSSRQAEIEKMEEEIRLLTRKARGEDLDDGPTKKKPKKSYLEEEMTKYAKSRAIHKKGKDGKRKDEGDVLAALSSFRTKLKDIAPEPDAEEPPSAEPANTNDQADAEPGALEEEEGMEVDDDVGFMSHALHFAKDNTEETIKAERDYEVIDPRQRGARAT